jgi:hypothetical protein
VAALVLWPALAVAQRSAPTREQCLAQHEKGQQQRKTASLLEARQTLRACSDESCPGLVRADCLDLLADVERAVPSVSFEVVIDRQDIPDARVTVDGQPMPNARGVPYELNPGVHRFRTETPGKPPIEATEVIREGEKNRVIRLEWVPPPPPVVLAPREPTGPRPVPASAWVFSGLAVAAAGAGATFGVLALNKRSQLVCKPLCTDSDVQPVKSMALVSDLSFAGGVLLAGLASYFYFSRPVVPEKERENEHKLQPSALLAPGYGAIGLRGSF